REESVDNNSEKVDKDQVRKRKHKSNHVEETSKRSRVDYVEVDQIDSDDDQEDSEKEPDNNDEYTNND
ncbi:12140_t:CDS:2, partial [Cetraspora pellucida]